ncbi:hypothetical protein ACP3VU_01160 [Vibrio sp. PNB23_22_6]
MGKLNKNANQNNMNNINDRLSRIEEDIEKLSFYQFYHTIDIDEKSLEDLVSLKTVITRYIKATSDGWVSVLINGTRTSLPSGLRVSLTKNTGGRDYGVILEGVLSGKKFDVSSGYFDKSYARGDSLTASVVLRATGPVTVDGVSYNRELRLSYKLNGASKTAGPFLVKTDPTNPIPTGIHTLELPDFPHSLGAGYGAYGTVWFRIGNVGDRYVHPGRVSAGCLTCVPSTWNEIYQIMHICRSNGTTDVGVLDFS